MLARIHVRRDRIARDRKNGTRSQAIGVETTGMKKRYARFVTIKGPSYMIYSPDKPLKCGARAWLETESPVTLKK